ncbi:MAG: M3 family metallopeptidase [Flavobacteriaceae bacterium]|nr:M3 family metallopeptidase [Flavobacteriaceae bacterium]
MNNPLLHSFDTPFTAAPFSKIKNEHFKPAFEEAIALSKTAIDSIVSNPEIPTYENVIDAMEFSGDTLDRISSIFFNLNAAETTDELQKIAQEVSPMLSEFSNDVRLNLELFNKIKTIYLQKEQLNLTGEQLMVLEKIYIGFTRNGANLDKDQKKKLRKIDTALSKASLKFGENVLAETNAYQLIITEEEKLAGIPPTAIETAKALAKEKEITGWVFTLDYPSYIPVVTYAKNRALRKEIAIASGKKGFQKNEFNNEEVVLEIVNLRHKRARLLGYNSHAHFVLEERMSETPENVHAFLNDLLEKATPTALKQFKELQDFARKDGIETLEKWDSAYYSEKLKKELFNLDDEMLKPYFKLDNVVAGVFEIAHKLYDLNFEEIFNVDIYHPTVKTYRVTDTNNKEIALFYTDFFPRKGKRNGAWMTSFKNQYIHKGVNSRPHVSIVCNFSPPTESTPALLTFNEVTTLFHEFGHALHGMLANTTYPSLSGTSVQWDFVELPSQVLENWCFEKEALTLFANHYKDHSPLPMEYIDKIKELGSFMEGLQTLRQLSFGMLDMEWHGKDPAAIKDVKSFELEAFKNTQLFSDTAENCMSTAFSHIFQGGYSAGYYSYKWAEVLDADAFAFFKETGIFNKETATLFKNNVLSKGGTIKPMDLYTAFRGKKPNNKALLKRARLIS